MRPPNKRQEKGLKVKGRIFACKKIRFSQQKQKHIYAKALSLSATYNKPSREIEKFYFMQKTENMSRGMITSNNK
jgi:hypothetical protein